MKFSRRTTLKGILAAIANPKLSIEKVLVNEIPKPSVPIKADKSDIGRIVYLILNPGSGDDVLVKTNDDGFVLKNIFGHGSDTISYQEARAGISEYFSDVNNFTNIFTGHLDYITYEPIPGEVMDIGKLDEFTGNMIKNVMKKVDPYAFARGIVTGWNNEYVGLDQEKLDSLERYFNYWPPARKWFLNSTRHINDFSPAVLEKRLSDLRILRPGEAIKTLKRLDGQPRNDELALQEKEPARRTKDNFKIKEKPQASYDEEYSDEDLIASTHGGFAQGQSQYYDKGRFFEHNEIISTVSRMITEDPDVFLDI